MNLKVPDSDKVKDYLRAKVLAYEQPGCDNQVDAQVNEMLQLAANSPDRPATYMIPSADDLNKVRQASNIITVISDLNGGGDKAKMTWLAICGAEFPEVVGKVIDAQKSRCFDRFHGLYRRNARRYASSHDIQHGCEGLDSGQAGRKCASRRCGSGGSRFLRSPTSCGCRRTMAFASRERS